MLGVLTIALSIPVAVLTHGSRYLGQYYSANGFVATGIWVGVYFIINAVFGLRAANSNTSGKVSMFIG